MKTCRKCEQLKPVSEFGRKRDNADGLHSYCKPCNRQAASKWAADNPERKRAYDERRYPVRLGRARNKAKAERVQKKCEMPYVDPASWENYVETGHNKGIYRKVDITYQQAHVRVRERFGKAFEYPCVYCGQQAREWSYSGCCPDVMYGDNGHGVMMYYSPNPEMYYPQCRKCHAAYDRNMADTRAAYALLKRFLGTVKAA